MPVLDLFLIGAVLGMRFKFLILVPAIGSALTAIFVGSVTRGDSAAMILVTAVVASSCLQIGYLGGVVTHHTAVLARAGRTTSPRASSSSLAAPDHSGGAAASTKYRG
jgi:hypothetical protein